MKFKVTIVKKALHTSNTRIYTHEETIDEYVNADYLVEKNGYLNFFTKTDRLDKLTATYSPGNWISVKEVADDEI